MLTREEQKRLQELEAKPFGTLTSVENAELAYLQRKRDGIGAGFISRDRTMPEDFESSANPVESIKRDPTMPE